MRKKRSGHDYEEEGSGSDRSPPSKKKKKARSTSSGDSEELLVREISKNRRVTVKIWKGAVVVDIREYYDKDGKLLPGNKGITIPVDQWIMLRGLIDEIDKAVADNTK